MASKPVSISREQAKRNSSSASKKGTNESNRAAIASEDVVIRGNQPAATEEG